MWRERHRKHADKPSKMPTFFVACHTEVGSKAAVGLAIITEKNTGVEGRGCLHAGQGGHDPEWDMAALRFYGRIAAKATRNLGCAVGEGRFARSAALGRWRPGGAQGCRRFHELRLARMRLGGDTTMGCGEAGIWSGDCPVKCDPGFAGSGEMSRCWYTTSGLRPALGRHLG